MLDLETIERDRAARIAFWRERGVYADRTYADYIGEGAARFGDVPVVFHSQRRPVTTTVGEMDRQAERLASAFHGLGLKAGDGLAVMAPTWCETVLAYLAGFKLGLVVIPIVAIYGPREIGFIMRQTGAKALVIPDEWRGHDYPARVAEAGHLPDLKRLIVVGDKVAKAAVAWSDLASHADADYPHASVGGDDLCLIVYTSGTTSDPKGVKHTHNTMLCDLNAARTAGAAAAAPPLPPGTSLCVFPAGHIAGFLAMMRPTLSGAQSVFMDHWVPEDAARLIERYRIVSSVGTPIFLSTLMKAAEETGADISSLNRFVLGASAITSENIRWTDELGFPSGRSYGMTEHSVVANSDGESFEKRAYTDGRITARNEVRVIDDADRDLPVGETGEVASRGPRLFMGYVDSRLDTECFLPGGWFKTGDIGRMDADGYLTITDRKKDIIIRGGENISSKEVEDILATMEGVVESAVTAMPDPVMGERVCAFVLAKPGVAVTLETVAAHFKAMNITRQKIPERVIQVDDLPRTPSGKVRKNELRDLLRASATAPA